MSGAFWKTGETGGTGGNGGTDGEPMGKLHIEHCPSVQPLVTCFLCQWLEGDKIRKGKSRK